jgi:hypothetical protein
MSQKFRHDVLTRITLLALIIIALATAKVATAGAQHQLVRLESVGGSGVTGLVNLVQHPNAEGTHINVVAFGLTPGNTYVSLYYDNHECALEPYSADDIIGGNYTANSGGVGHTDGEADDDLDEINSVSVRRADDFTLLACADVHP